MSVGTGIALYVPNFNHRNKQFLRTDIGGGCVRNCVIWGVERHMKNNLFLK